MTLEEQKILQQLLNDDYVICIEDLGYVDYFEYSPRLKMYRACGKDPQGGNNQINLDKVRLSSVFIYQPISFQDAANSIKSSQISENEVSS